MWRKLGFRKTLKTAFQSLCCTLLSEFYVQNSMTLPKQMEFSIIPPPQKKNYLATCSGETFKKAPFGSFDPTASLLFYLSGEWIADTTNSQLFHTHLQESLRYGALKKKRIFKWFPIFYHKWKFMFQQKLQQPFWDTRVCSNSTKELCCTSAHNGDCEHIPGVPQKQ